MSDVQVASRTSRLQIPPHRPAHQHQGHMTLSSPRQLSVLGGLRYEKDWVQLHPGVFRVLHPVLHVQKYFMLFNQEYIMFFIQEYLCCSGVLHVQQYFMFFIQEYLCCSGVFHVQDYFIFFIQQYLCCSGVLPVQQLSFMKVCFFDQVSLKVLRLRFSLILSKTYFNFLSIYIALQVLWRRFYVCRGSIRSALYLLKQHEWKEKALTAILLMHSDNKDFIKHSF